MRFPLVRITLEFFSAVVWVGWWHCPCLQGAGRIPSSSSTSVCMSFNAQGPCLKGTPHRVCAQLIAHTLVTTHQLSLYRGFSAVVWVGWGHCPWLQAAGRIPSSSSTSVCISCNAQGTPKGRLPQGYSALSTHTINCAHSHRSSAQPLPRLVLSVACGG